MDLELDSSAENMQDVGNKQQQHVGNEQKEDVDDKGQQDVGNEQKKDVCDSGQHHVDIEEKEVAGKKGQQNVGNEQKKDVCDSGQHNFGNEQKDHVSDKGKQHVGNKQKDVGDVDNEQQPNDGTKQKEDVTNQWKKEYGKERKQERNQHKGNTLQHNYGNGQYQEIDNAQKQNVDNDLQHPNIEQNQDGKRHKYHEQYAEQRPDIGYGNEQHEGEQKQDVLNIHGQNEKQAQKDRFLSDSGGEIGCPHKLLIKSEYGRAMQVLGAPKINLNVGRIAYYPNRVNVKYIK